MKNDKGKNILIIILLVIIVGLFAVIFLMYNGTLKLETNQDNKVENETVKEFKELSNEEALLLGKDLYDKVTEIKETWVLLPYCGLTKDEINKAKIYEFESTNHVFYKSTFKNFDALKEYLKLYLSDELINSTYLDKIIDDVTLIKDNNEYINYIEKEDGLYCRRSPGKGWLSTYLGTYDIEISNLNKEVITYKITSYYAENQNAECWIDNNASVNTCKENEISTKETNFTIQKNNENNWIATDYTLHD